MPDPSSKVRFPSSLNAVHQAVLDTSALNYTDFMHSGALPNMLSAPTHIFFVAWPMEVIKSWYILSLCSGFPALCHVCNVHFFPCVIPSSNPSTLFSMLVHFCVVISDWKSESAEDVQSSPPTYSMSIFWLRSSYWIW